MPTLTSLPALPPSPDSGAEIPGLVQARLPRRRNSGGLHEAAATFLMDDLGIVQGFDTEAEHLFHCRAEDVQGQPINVLFRDFPPALFKQDDSEPVSRRLKLSACPKDGSRLPVEVTLTQICLGTQRLWVGAIRAPSAQMLAVSAQMENTQNARAREMQTIFDAVGVGIIRLDMTGKLIESNAAFQQMLGYTSQDLEGMALARLAHPDDAAANVQKEWDFQEGVSDGYRIEKRFCCQDGATVWADLMMSLVRDAEKRPQFAIAVVEDITEKRQAQQTILALNAHLERRMQSISALRRIDMEIIAGSALETVLGMVLDQVRTVLGVDAAAALLCRPETRTLDYAVAGGMRHSLSEFAPPTYDFGYAGQAVREHETVHIPNLGWMPDVFSHDPAMASEGFLAYWAVPLIAKGEVRGVLEIFHRSLLDADAEWRDFLEALAGQAALAIDSATMFQDLQRSNRELREAYEDTIEGWGRALDLRDQETEGHSRRVTDLTERLACALDMSAEERTHLRRGALLHDIGKVGVPDRILLKTDDLTPTEWRLMRRHPQDAYDMLYPITFLRPALDIPRCHHEKWDGTGYPQGLKGDQIPLAARLFAIVDVWDALRSERPYRRGWPEPQVLAHIRSLAGTHFDPDMVEAFLAMMTAQPELTLAETADSDLLQPLTSLQGSELLRPLAA